MTASTVRTITEDEFGEWFDVIRASLFMVAGELPDEAALRDKKVRFELDRCLAAVGTDAKLCGTAAAFTTELTVPGGAVPAAGVTVVGVLPTHRRQGHLSAMMRSQLADVAERGEPVAALVASEYPIYSRYGYGPAAEASVIRVDAGSLRGLPGAGWTTSASGRVELVDTKTFAAALPGVYDRARRRFPGHITWQDDDLQVIAGLIEPLWGASKKGAFKALWYDGNDEPQGAVLYTLKHHWEDNRPKGKLTADPLVAVTDEAERELARYLTAVDLVATVRLELRPVDDPLPLWLQDARLAAVTDRSDHLWVRVLDVPTALTARRYQTPGRVVIQVDDPMGFATGRFQVEATDDGTGNPGGYPATCTPTSAGADLVVPIHALGSAYLGGMSWSRLAAAGWVDEHRPGGVARAAAMFSTPRAPWCAQTF